MKVFVLFEKNINNEYWEVDGLGRAVGACFNEEQAREIARERTLEFWRDPPGVALESLGYFLDEVGHDITIVTEPDRFWRLIEETDEYDRNMLMMLDVIAVDIAALPQTSADRSDVLHALSGLLAPWAPDAARALKEDA